MIGDGEVLDLIAYHRWPIVWNAEGKCIVIAKGGNTQPVWFIGAAVVLAVEKHAEWEAANGVEHL